VHSAVSVVHLKDVDAGKRNREVAFLAAEKRPDSCKLGIYAVQVNFEISLKIRDGVRTSSSV
jgi:hypothetical protein